MPIFSPDSSVFSLQNTATTSTRPVLPQKEQKKILRDMQKQILVLQEKLFAEKKQSLLCMFQAMDAAGKDGTINSVFSGLLPMGIAYHAFTKPTKPELARDYLWRIHQVVPQKGNIGVFNRSHYEEIITVRVFPEFLLAQHLPPGDIDSIIQQRIEDIKAFEQLLARNGTRILKFFLHVGKEEQGRRLQERMENPNKHWKHDSHDLVCRAKWMEFMHAYEQAIIHTHTPYAPWYIIPADDKPTMRIDVAEILLQTLSDMEPKFPAVSPAQLESISKDRTTLLS